MEKKILFHIPHDGNVFPQELMKAVCVPNDIFMRYHRQMRDFAVREFVPSCITSRAVIFEISRLLCDVERFIGKKECMEAYGMGFCYEKVYDGTVIKTVDADIKSKTYRYYQEHHRKLDREVLDMRGKILLFDLHSFSKTTLLKEANIKHDTLPDICVGVGGHMPGKNTDRIIRSFQNAGFSVAVNYPYSGSLVPKACLSGKTDAEILSCMIEVNKSVYLTSDGCIIPTEVKKIQAILTALSLEID